MSILSERAPHGSINFGIGEPTYPTPVSLKERIIRMVEEDSAEYGPVAGLLNFREFLADWYSHKNLCFEASSQNVVATCGVTEAIFISLQSLINAGDEVICPDPGFVLYEPAIKICGGIPVSLPLVREKGFSIDAQRLERLITSKTKALILNSPSNPTGRVIQKKTLKEIAEICQEKAVTIISDEIYEHLVYESDNHSISEFADNVIVCSGISKLFRLAGWRLGWCVAGKDLMANLVKCHQYCVFRAPTISQRIAPIALTQKKEIRQMVDFYRRKRDFFLSLMKSINGIELAKPEATFFTYTDFSKYCNDWELALKFLKKGVITVPSTGPGAGFGSNGKGFIRLSYALEDHAIRAGVSKIKEVLESLSK